jgi:hypothetical protein
LLFSIGVDSLARLGNRARGLTHEEYKWANEQVYQGALPPMDTLLLTDTIGGGGRPFTFKRWDGKITLNLGEKGWADPRHFTPGKYGQVFIQELMHACQIQHSQNISFTLSAILAQGKQVLGGDPYKYGKAGAEYRRLGIEQQAQIISDWFAGDAPPAPTKPANQWTRPVPTSATSSTTCGSDISEDVNASPAWSPMAETAATIGTEAEKATLAKGRRSRRTVGP